MFRSIISDRANHIRAINDIKLEPQRVLQPSKTALQNGRAATITLSSFMNNNILPNPENASNTDLNGPEQNLRLLHILKTTKKTHLVEVRYVFKMVVGGGFEPPKASLADLQSAPFSHSGIPPVERVRGVEPL